MESSTITQEQARGLVKTSPKTILGEIGTLIQMRAEHGATQAQYVLAPHVDQKVRSEVVNTLIARGFGVTQVRMQERGETEVSPMTWSDLRISW